MKDKYLKNIHSYSNQPILWSYSSNVWMDTLDFVLSLDLWLGVSYTVVMDNPIGAIFKVVWSGLTCNNKNQKSNQNSRSNCDTEGNESCSVILSSFFPFEWVWVEVIVEVYSVVLNGSENTSCQWTDQSLDSEKEWSASCKFDTALHDFLFSDVEQRLQQTGNHTQKNSRNRGENMNSTGSNNGGSGKSTVHQVFDSDSSVNKCR